MAKIKFILHVIVVSIFFIAIHGQAMASTDTVTSLTELQTRLQTVMSSRVTNFSIVYTGNTSTFKADLDKLLTDIYDQDDYLHYSTKLCSYSGYIFRSKANINFTFSYLTDTSQIAFVDNRIAAILGQIISPEMNDYQKEKAIHDWIVKNVAYDTTLVQHSDYAALVPPYKTVCQGYSLLVYKMLTKAGIQTRIIEGNSASQAHTWNEVYIDGAWYHLDCTWDDPLPDRSGKVSYNYYNLTDEQMKSDHTWTKNYPAANTDFGTVLKTKIDNGAFYKELFNDIGFQYFEETTTASSSLDIKQKILNAIKNNQTEFTFRYINGSKFKNDLQNAINSITSISTYRYSTSDYTRSALAGDVLIELQIVDR